MKKLVFLLALILLSITVVQSQGYPETAYIAWHPNGTMLAIAYKTRVDIFFFSRDADHGGFRVTNSFTDIQTSSPPAWSPDGNRIAFSNDTDVEVWSTPWDSSLAQQEIVYQYYEPGTPQTQLVTVWNIVFSPDGTKIASSFGGGIDIWNSSSGELLLRLPISGFGGWDWITDLVWSDDNRLALSSTNGYVPTLNPETGEAFNYYRTGSEIEGYYISSIDFSPDANKLALGLEFGAVQIWGDTRVLNQLVELPMFIYPHHDLAVTTLDWNPLGKFIASGDADGRIRVWDVETGEDYWTTDLGAGVHVDTVAWSPDGTELAYMDAEGELQIVPISNVPQEIVEPSVEHYLEWSPDGEVIAIASTDLKPKAVVIVRRESRIPFYEFDPMNRYKRLTWSPNGDRIALADGYILKIKPAETLKNQDTWFTDYVLLEYAEASGGVIQSVDWHPSDDKFLFSYGVPFIYDLLTKTIVEIGDGSISDARVATWSSDGALFAFGTDTHLYIGDENTGQIINAIQLRSMTGDFSVGGHAVAWNSDDSKIAVAGDDGTVHIIPLSDELEFSDSSNSKIIVASNEGLLSIDWTTDDTFLATGGLDGFLKIWSADTLNLIASIEVGKPIHSVVWSPDGLYFAYVDEAGKVQVVPAPDVGE